jgi:hypothetical protein
MENNFLIPFVQHGFRKAGYSGKQVSGYCPLCDHKNPKMFVNSENGLWDCKVCGKSGNVTTFLKLILEKAQDAFTQETAEALVKAKGIKYETFKRGGVGYNSINESYLFPVMTSDDKVHDLRFFHIGGKVFSTKGCHVGLRGWNDFGRPGEVWITEGESDYFTLTEVFYELNRMTDVIVSLPGAGTFKAEWFHMFSGRKVHVLLDNDDAGRKGSINIFNKLNTIVGKIDFFHWGKEHSSGYDIRDLYRHLKNPKVFLEAIRNGLKNMPMGFKGVGSNTEEAIKPVEAKRSSIRLSSDKIYDGYRKWLKFDDEHVLDVIFGTAIANRLPGDPLWLFLVAPPGGMKSELLMSMDSAQKMYATTSVTPASLISGMNVGGNIDPSLIPRLNGKVLLIKDFTTILKLPPMIKDEIFGIFRDAYDGKIEKQFGNGVLRKYNSRFGVIAGVTPAIYTHTDENVVLGERFLMYHIKTSDRHKDRRDMIERALENVTHEDKMRKELNLLATSILDYDYSKNGVPETSKESRHIFISLAQYASVMRAGVIRDKYTREITHKPFSEIGTRLAKQFMKLALGISYFRGDRTVKDTTINVIRSIAKNTVPQKIENAFEAIYKKFKEAPFTQTQAADVIGLPPAVAGRVVEDLKYLRVLEMERLSSMSSIYRVNTEFKEIIEGAKIYG